MWIEGRVVPELFVQAVSSASAETDVLRLRFSESAQGPRQEVRSGARLLTAVHSSVPRSDEAIRTGLRSALLHPRDPATEQLTTSELHPRQDGGWAWALTTHHLLLDAYGLALFNRRVAELYTSISAGTHVPSRWFGDLGDLLDDGTTATAADPASETRHWRRTLAEVDATPRPAEHRHLAPVVRCAVPVERNTLVAVRDLARRARASVPAVAAAAWSGSLAARLGLTQLVFRVPLMNRNSPAKLRTPGMLVTILPLVVDLSPAETFEDLTHRLSAEIAALRRRGTALSTEAIMRLWPAGPASYEGLPSINVKAFDYRLRFDGVPGVQETIASGPVDGPELSIYDDATHGLRLDLAASTHRRTPAELHEDATALTRILTAAAEHPRTPVSALDALPPKAGEGPAGQGIGAEPDGPAPATVDALLRALVATEPDTTAVIAGDLRLTRRQLDLRTEEIARMLRERGISPGERAALLLPRGVAHLTALAGILRAGGAYVPLDTAYPTERIRHILDDARPRLLLTDEATASRHAETLSRIRTAGISVLVLDAPDGGGGSGSRADAPPGCDAVVRPLTERDAAAIIYTSGTTGRPKGAVLSHGALAGRLRWSASALGQGPGSVAVWKSRTGFVDGSTELLGPLTAGATVIIADDETAADPARLAGLIGSHGVTHLLTVPSLAAVLIDTSVEGDLDSLRSWTSSGEALTDAHIDAMRAAAPHATLHNLYGSTEVAGDATHAVLAPGERTGIGTPVPGSFVRVLDPWLRAIPAGTIGELFLGGPQLADCYAGAPALSAGRFVADPYDDAGGRLYRTGDLVSRTADGRLRFQGRTDDQIKIRGFRIETGEVSAVVEEHPAVAAAAVVSPHDPVRGRYLAAYYTLALPHHGRDLGEELRAFTAERLPDFMVPSAFIPLDALPTTPHGKIDRDALPVPDLSHSGTDGPAARTSTERLLAGAFRDLLGLGREPGVHADFFRHGGHSLLATRFLARVNAALDADLTLRDVFDTPTVAGLAARLERQPGSGRTHPVRRLREVPRAGIVPASYGQQSLWLIDRIAGAGRRYLVPIVLRLAEPLDHEALAWALGNLVRRHEPLRTLLVEEDGKVVQRIVPPAEALDRLTVTVEELPDGESAEARLRADLHRSFDLAHDLPLRASLLRTATGPVLTLTMHHHAVDEWSLPTLLEDLSLAYAARVAGRAADPRPLPVHYAEYSVWQRERLGDPHAPDSQLAAHLAYWRRTLAGAPEESSLPTDFARPAEPAHTAAHIAFRVDSGTVQRLRTVLAQHGASLFMAVHSAAGLTVALLGDRDDVVIGSPVSGREEEDLDDLVGYFVNTLPVRQRFAPRQTLEDVIKTVRQTVLGGFDHQAAPFEEIVRALGGSRSMALNPLFQIMITHRTGKAVELGAALRGPLKGTIELPAPDFVKTDLELDFRERGDDCSGLLSYSTELFDRATVERFITVFLRLIEHLARAPGTRIADLRLFEESEANSIAAWSHASRSGMTPGPSTLDSLLRHQSARSPEAMALLAEDGTWRSYGQLDEEINRGARLLLRRGAGPGSRVAVLLPRSVENVIGLASASRAGAAFVPLDPAHPTARLAEVFDDSRPRAVLTTRATAEAHASAIARARSAGSSVIVVDEDATVRERAELPGLPVGPEETGRPLDPGDAAALIYTSGTTGRPKGVLVSHGALTGRLSWGAPELDLGPESVVVWKTGLGFVDACTELFGPLVSGARVVVAPEDAAGDPHRLAELIDRQQITHLLTVPSLASTLAEISGDRLRSLRSWVSSGEALSRSCADVMRTAAPRAIVRNLYGSTEITGDGTLAEISTGGTPAIGSPVPGVVLRVLDSRLSPVVPGAIGELYLGGAQLAAGYHDRHGLTAERFVADPLADDGSRLYRTGDRVRWSVRGALEYLGRTDDQIKIRGFRIEPDEVRAVLERHPLVSGAVVVAADHPASGKLLAAYYTSAGRDGEPAGRADTADALREFAAGHLPDYMVPSAFVEVGSFPTSPNGKLDKRALPALQPERAHAGDRTPSSRAEQVLTAVFREALGLAEDAAVPVERDFFRLGGDSLLAARVVSLARQEGLVLTVRDVFEQRTVAQLAAQLDQQTEQTDEEEAAAPAEPIAVPPSATLEALRESGSEPNSWIHTETIGLPAPVDAARLTSVLRELTGAIDALRLRVDPKNKRLWLSEVLPPDDTDLSGQITHTGSLADALDSATGAVDITAGLPLAAAVVTDEPVIVLAVHAAAADRSSAHRLATLLTALLDRSPTGPASTTAGWAQPAASLGSILEEYEEQGSRHDESRIGDWLTLLERGAAAQEQLDPEQRTVATVQVPASADPLDPAGLEQAVLTTLAQALPGTVVDIETPLSPEPRPDTIGPFTAIAPVDPGVRDAADVHAASREFALLRHYNRQGRRALRRAPRPDILLARSCAVPADERRREGAEQLYRGVIRYRYEPGAPASIALTLLGFSAVTATALKTALHTALAEAMAGMETPVAAQQPTSAETQRKAPEQ